MSIPAEHLVASEPGIERRFYQRTAPHALIGVPFAEDNSGMLLNVSENGLLVSTPLALAQNFVCRVSLLLNGLTRPIEVWAHVVWTTESRAGLQLLDLGDHDRERIRKWAALEEAPVGSEEQRETSTGKDAGQQNVGSPTKSRENRRPSRLLLAACSMAALVMLVMALALQGSPLHAWLTRSFRAGLRNSVGTQTHANLSSQRVGPQAQPPAPSVAQGANPSGGVQAGSTLAERPASASAASGETKEAAKTEAIPDDRWPAALPQKKSPPTASHSDDSRGKPAAPSSTVAGRSGAEPVPSPEAVERGESKEGADESAPVASGADTATTKSPDTNSPNATEEPANAARPSRVGAASPPTTEAPPAGDKVAVERADPVAVQTETPQSRALTLSVPNRATPSLMSVPGERLVEATTATVHIQRSIVVPASHKHWAGEQKENVVLGDLLSRVDPQPPRVMPTDTRVSVRAIVGKDGRVERLMPVNGPVALVFSAARAVRQWRFQPTLLDGKPVETEALLLIEFRTRTERVQP